MKTDFHNWLVANEGSGILNRLIDGYACYVANGRKFDEPITVIDATDQYRFDEDPLAEFVADCITESEDPDREELSSLVYTRYVNWCEMNGTKNPFGRRKFVEMLSNKFPRKRASAGPHKGKQIYRGIDLVKE